jgi:hypothetical protein
MPAIVRPRQRQIERQDSSRAEAFWEIMRAGPLKASLLQSAYCRLDDSLEQCFAKT